MLHKGQTKHHFLLFLFFLNQSFSTRHSMNLKDQKYKGPFSIDNSERRSHARGVYPTQDTSRMGTVKMKQEEETDKNNARE